MVLAADHRATWFAVRCGGCVAMRGGKFKRRELPLDRPTWDGSQTGRQDGNPDSFGVVFHEISLVLATLLAIAVVTNVLFATHAP